MTLIEAVVAAAVVLTVSTAATGACLSARAAAGAGNGRQAAESCVAAQVEALRALPFDDPSYLGAAPPADLLATVFPHADVARNVPAAFFAIEPRDGCAAGTFFTVLGDAGARRTIAATFLVAGATGFRPLDPARLAGYDHTVETPVPAAALLLRVSAPWRGGRHGGTVTRTVVLADRPLGLCPVAVPSPA